MSVTQIRASVIKKGNVCFWASPEIPMEAVFLQLVLDFHLQVCIYLPNYVVSKQTHHRGLRKKSVAPDMLLIAHETPHNMFKDPYLPLSLCHVI